MKAYIKAIVMVAFVAFIAVSATALAEDTIDPEFTLLYATTTNDKYTLVLTSQDFLTDANGVQTIRIYFGPGVGETAAIRLHEIRAFTDEEGTGENILLNAPVIGGPIYYQYYIEWIVNGVGFPADMQPSPDTYGIGWADKWYTGESRGVAYITLKAPANIKRIELEMGYSNKGLPLEVMNGIDIRVSPQLFSEEELVGKMDAVLRNFNYVGALQLP